MALDEEDRPLASHLPGLSDQRKPLTADADAADLIHLFARLDAISGASDALGEHLSAHRGFLPQNTSGVSPPSPSSVSPSHVIPARNNCEKRFENMLHSLARFLLVVHDRQQELRADHTASVKAASERSDALAAEVTSAQRIQHESRLEQAAHLAHITAMLEKLTVTVSAAPTPTPTLAPLPIPPAQPWLAAARRNAPAQQNARAIPAQPPPRAPQPSAQASEPEAAPAPSPGPVVFPAPYNRRALVIGVPVAADMAELRACLQDAAAVGADVAVESVTPLPHSAAPGRDGGGLVHLVEVQFTSASVMSSALRNFRSVARLPYSPTLVESVPPVYRTTRNHRRDRLKDLDPSMIKATVMGVDFYYRGPPPPPGAITKAGWIWAPSFEALQAVALAHPLPHEDMDVEAAPLGPPFGARPTGSASPPSGLHGSRSRTRSPSPRPMHQWSETTPPATAAAAGMDVDRHGLPPEVSAPSTGASSNSALGGSGGGA